MFSALKPYKRKIKSYKHPSSISNDVKVPTQEEVRRATNRTVQALHAQLLLDSRAEQMLTNPNKAMDFTVEDLRKIHTHRKTINTNIGKLKSDLLFLLQNDGTIVK